MKPDKINSKINNPNRIGAIDIGTNSFHLVIVELDEKGRYEIICREKESVRLGSGSGDMEIISVDAMDRGINVLSRFVKIVESHNATIRAVATSAVREAKNNSEFLNRITNISNLSVEVIPGLEEARLIYLGILQKLPVFDKKILLIDIGGGSTEFLIGEKGVVLFATSLKLGAIRLNNRFFSKEPLKEDQIKECRKFIQVALARTAREVNTRGFEIAIGSSGTINTLLTMIQENDSIKIKNEIDFVDNSFNIKELNRISNLIISHQTSKERSQLAGLDAKRGDIIVGGTILLQESFKALKIKNLIYSGFALREGIIFDTIARKNIPGSISTDIRSSSVEHFYESCSRKKITPDRSEKHIKYLALNLFAEMQRIGKIPELNANDAFILGSAGLLHNVGVLIAHSAHHKHGFYMIKNSDKLLGFTREEITILALLTRYHRKTLPVKKHSEFNAMPGKVQKKIEQMGSILRIAVGLDRSNQARVSDIELISEEKYIIFNVIPALPSDNVQPDITLEIWAGKMNALWFEKVFKVKTEFRISAVRSKFKNLR